jgi:cyclophilin family peptidyl-prolyl cis-trans isomerase
VSYDVPMKIMRLAVFSLLALTLTASAQTSNLRRGMYAHFETSLGAFTAVLEAGLVPRTVNNFVSLARGTKAWTDPTGAVMAGKPFYDGLIFHRVVRDFVIQTGDPTGNGAGGPGYTIADEFSPSIRHDQAGILSMGNKGARDTGGSQIFITLREARELNNVNAAFGRVIRGMDVVRKIGNVRTKNDRPVEPVVLQHVRIEIVE